MGLNSKVFYAQPVMDSILVKISEKYQGLDHLYMEQEVSFYESYNAVKAYEIEQTILKKKQNRLYTKAFNQEKIVDRGLNVIVDHTAKILMVDLLDKETMDHSLGFDLIRIKELSYKAEHQKVNEQIDKCVFYFKIGDHARSEVWFNRTTYEIKKIVYYFNKPIPMNENELPEETAKRELPRVEIKIKTTDFIIEFSDEEFAWKDFISITDDKVVPTEKYKNYTLINNIEQ